MRLMHLAVAVAWFSAPFARAADVPVPATALDVNPWHLDAGGHGVLSTPTSRVLGHLNTYGVLALAHVERPLVASSTSDPDAIWGLVSRREALDVGGALGVSDRVEFGFTLPVIVDQIAEKIELGFTQFALFFHDRAEPETLECFATEVIRAFRE